MSKTTLPKELELEKEKVRLFIKHKRLSGVAISNELKYLFNLFENAEKLQSQAKERVKQQVLELIGDDLDNPHLGHSVEANFCSNPECCYCVDDQDPEYIRGKNEEKQQLREKVSSL